MSGGTLRTTLTLLVALAAAAPAWSDQPSTAKQLAEQIDRRLREKWTIEKIEPAPPASDAEFVRRVYLDLAGRIPRVSETRDFLADPAADKRERLIERLLASPQFVTHWTNTWRDIILPAVSPQQTFLAANFRAWLEQQIKEDAPYNRMVRELLSAAVNPAAQSPGRLAALSSGEPTPVAFYQAQEFKAENLAAVTSRTFLGFRLECAQCHDHPFTPWTQNSFWELAAFFSGVQPGGPRVPGAQNRSAQPVANPGKQIKIPGKDKIILAKFPTGEVPEWKSFEEPRMTLALWVTARDNPYFARTAANRVWAHFFGIGLIDPVDEEPTEDNPLREPELLGDLTQQLIAHNFELKHLIRAITRSEAYQRSSMTTHPSQKDLHRFARMPLRGLTPEQLFDSLATATGYRDPAPGQRELAGVIQAGSPRAEFVNRFQTQERRTETQTSILQALALMNGRFISDATSLSRSATLAAVIDAPFLTTEQRLETLYLAALSRLPRPEERDRLLSYIERGGASGAAAEALADVFWALLNTSEFLFNH